MERGHDDMNSAESILEIHSGIVLKGQLSMDRDIVLTGKFEGDLKTLGRVTVTAGGVALGSIEAGALVLEPGNLVEARVKVASPGGAHTSPDSAGGANAARWPLSLKRLTNMALGRK
jgi:hypothetical protein